MSAGRRALDINKAGQGVGSGSLAVQAVGLTKRFGATVALSEADFSCRHGEIHVLLGANGAGKSTLVKILSGVYAPDEGILKVDGQTVRFANPSQAAAAGIAAVFQELSLCPHMTVTENVMLGHEPTRALGQIDQRRCRQTVQTLFQRLHITHIGLNTPVNLLPLADRQLIEIVKALSHDPQLLIVDEGTSALGHDEVKRLFALLDALRHEGRAVLFISHRMAEVRSLADRMTVFRNGRHAGTYVASEVSDDQLIEAMLGRQIHQAFPVRSPVPAEAPIVLEVQQLSAGDRLRDVSLSVRAGEIVGIAGLEGQGQGDLLLALFGVLRRPQGLVQVHGKPVRLGTPWHAVQAGFVLVPEDRRTQGLVQPMSIRVNITLASLARLVRRGLIDTHRERQMTDEGVDQVQIKAASPELPVSALSGGNQQKVIIAKWLLAGGDVFMFYDPTRGVDVGTKGAFYELLIQLTQAGQAVLLYTTELPEFVGLCHRVLVMNEGRIVGELMDGDVTESRILAKSLGVEAPVLDAPSDEEASA